MYHALVSSRHIVSTADKASKTTVTCKIWAIYLSDIDGSCRGIVTADVLLQGLNHGAIATRKLKGINWGLY